MPKHPKLEKEIAALGDLPRQDLIARWAAIYGCPAPSGASRKLLLYGCAWHLQAKRLGGFSPETRRLLKKLVQQIRSKMIGTADAHTTVPRAGPQEGDAAAAAVSGASSSKRARPERDPRRRLSAGARLLREWNGRTHVIDVTEGGFLFEGQSYRSLSAIARTITGAQWSGPRFFGL